MSAFLLTPTEVEELTGTPRPRLQMEWLGANGFRAEMGRDGKVKVLRAAVEQRMMPSGSRARPKTEPDLSAIKKAS